MAIALAPTPNIDRSASPPVEAQGDLNRTGRWLVLA